jgi:putative membrane protein
MMISEYALALISWLVSAVALVTAAYFLKGFKVGSFASALVIALVVGFANAFIRPVLLFLTFPINLVTFGLFTIVVNGIILRLCAAVLPNFSIKNWGTAFIASVIIAITGTILQWLVLSMPVY